MLLQLVRNKTIRLEGDRANVCIEEKDLIIIGGGVAGYVAAIKAGQEGLKVQEQCPSVNTHFV